MLFVVVVFHKVKSAFNPPELILMSYSYHYAALPRGDVGG